MLQLQLSKSKIMLLLPETSIENYDGIATQTIENYVSIAKNLYQKLCWRHCQRKST